MLTSRRAWWFAALFVLPSCRDVDQDAGDTEGTSTGDTSGPMTLTTTTSPPTTTTDTADTTGGPDPGLEPCDPTADDCAPMRCGGAPTAGYDGQTCIIAGGAAIGGIAYVCSSAGPLDAGGDCTDDDSACGLGLQCVGDVCVEICDPNADDCAQGTCADASATLYLPAGTIGFCV